MNYEGVLRKNDEVVNGQRTSESETRARSRPKARTRGSSDECATEELSRRRNGTGVQRVDRVEWQQTSSDVCADEWFEEIKP